MRAALYLNSESPRRQALLGQLGVAFVTISAPIDETWNGAETPACYVERMALEKAQFGWRSIAQRNPLPVLGADTAVVLEGTILGKPGDPSDAVNMLAAVSGRHHEVYTAVALVEPSGASHRSRVNMTRVYLRAIAACEREAYVATGEPFGKAGAYAIQGLAAACIERIEGSYSGVMGLPLYETAELLRAAGIEILACDPQGTSTFATKF
ncbi:MAG: Maf family protein [Gammaproteobacteria bacterium]